MHLGNIFKTIFPHCPTPHPKLTENPHTSNGLSVAVFLFKSEKTYHWSQLGTTLKGDPKRLLEYVVNKPHMGNVTNRFANDLYFFVPAINRFEKIRRFHISI